MRRVTAAALVFVAVFGLMRWTFTPPVYPRSAPWVDYLHITCENCAAARSDEEDGRWTRDDGMQCTHENGWTTCKGRAVKDWPSSRLDAPLSVEEMRYLAAGGIRDLGQGDQRIAPIRMTAKGLVRAHCE